MRIPNSLILKKMDNQTNVSNPALGYLAGNVHHEDLPLGTFIIGHLDTGKTMDLSEILKAYLCVAEQAERSGTDHVNRT